MLLDTCALLWITLKPDILTEAEREIALEAIESGSAALSAISIWEIGIKIKKGKLKIGMPLEHYVRRIKELKGIEIVPVVRDVWNHSGLGRTTFCGPEMTLRLGKITFSRPGIIFDRVIVIPGAHLSFPKQKKAYV